MKNIVLAIKLIFYFFLITTLTLFLVRLGVASVFMISNGGFFFEWRENLFDSIQRGAVIGLVLGIGVLFLSSLKRR
ncbi:hypothetical protein HZD82_21185 [Pantoea agglomerans]|uniref:hypothetical protein n=1 Tax=Pantoea TaxID=53335 RepID=UPI00139968A0|nr:hypothetical protein [Pantoea agglomerans]MBN9931110.1 hypothetical protein [Pantoea agglomerans]QIA51888.1 hypothetical protein GW574_05905 [Pantoea agglomerans]